MINLDHFDQLKRHKPAAIGFLLVVIGFVGGYFTRGETTPPPRAHHGQQVRMARIHGPAPAEMHWRHRAPQTTIIVMQDGRSVEVYEQYAPVAIAAPPQERPNHTKFLFALLALSLMPVIVWGALAWNRQRQQPVNFKEPNSYEDTDFVPRRDD